MSREQKIMLMHNKADLDRLISEALGVDVDIDLMNFYSFHGTDRISIVGTVITDPAKVESKRAATTRSLGNSTSEVESHS